MTVRLLDHAVRAVVLDIEGTTTPIAFVYGVLFPFARAHLREHLERALPSDESVRALASLRDEWQHDRQSGHGPPAIAGDAPTALIPYIEWLMDRDRKSFGLKLLQGEVWRRGYEAGALRGDVFDDVPPALARWKSAGVRIAIYSSGSVQAQRLLFGHTNAGDLTPFLGGFFDTGTGPKTSADSYRAIAASLDVPAEQLLFVSDAQAELSAARSAGCAAVLCIRPGNKPQAVAEPDCIRSFDEIV